VIKKRYESRRELVWGGANERSQGARVYEYDQYILHANRKMPQLIPLFCKN
jgi:hypothetical protein